MLEATALPTEPQPLPDKRTLRTSMAVVVAQLVEWSPLTPEIHGSNPVISKF